MSEKATPEEIETDQSFPLGLDPNTGKLNVVEPDDDEDEEDE